MKVYEINEFREIQEVESRSMTSKRGIVPPTEQTTFTMPPLNFDVIKRLYPNTRIGTYIEGSNFCLLWDLNDIQKSHPLAQPSPKALTFQYNYKYGKWEQYQEGGLSDNPTETFIRWIE